MCSGGLGGTTAGGGGGGLVRGRLSVLAMTSDERLSRLETAVMHLTVIACDGQDPRNRPADLNQTSEAAKQSLAAVYGQIAEERASGET